MSSEINLYEGPFDIHTILREKLYKLDESEREALYVCDLSDVRLKYMDWCKKMPRVKPFYAIKCNTDEKIVRLLGMLGAGFDCASINEMDAVLKQGVTPDRIIYAHPAKLTSHMKYAIDKKVDLMMFDSFEELERIHRIYPTARLVLRIRSDAYNAFCLHSAKFGCDPKLKAPYLLEQAKKLSMSVVGVNFHVGSGCKDTTAHFRGIEACRLVFDCALKLGHNISIIDIGGGFPGHIGSNFEEYADGVNAGLKKFFPESDPLCSQLKVIGEPGTYMVESCCSVGVTVYLKKTVYEEDNVARIKYYVTDSIHGTFGLVLFGLKKFVPQVLAHTKEDEEKLAKMPLIESAVWGLTCNGADLIADKIPMPILEIGDVLVFRNVGCYSLHVLGTSFNGFPVAKVIHFADNDTMKVMGDF